MDTLPATQTQSKVCTKCLASKPLSEFFIKYRESGRLHSRCKLCHMATCRSWQERNREQHFQSVCRWRANNPEKVRQANRKSKQKHAERNRAKARAEYAEKRREKNRSYRLANREQIKVRNAEYRQKNREKIAAYGLAYYQNNKAAVSQRIRRSNAKNPQLYHQLHKAAKHRRKVRLESSGPVERFTDLEIFERDNWTCHLCGAPVGSSLKHPDPMSASLDHVKPIARGGGHTRENTACSHLRCNLAKRDRYERHPTPNQETHK